MLRIPDLGRGPVRGSSQSSLRLMGLATAALMALSVAASERAQALSPINPGAAATANVAADGLTIEVRGGGHGGGGHGGGGHGGVGHGFGGHGFAGGSFHAGVAHYGGFGHGGHRFGHRHHFGRFFAGGYYYDDYPYYDYPYYAYPGCRVVLTDHGPRRICGYRSWRHHHYRRHHHHRHHHVHR